MAIVHMAANYTEAMERGINQRIYRHDGQVFKTEDGAEYGDVLWLYETHNGLCIHEREQNGYNDSDFFMVVWNKEKNAPECIEFASTRGWSYPCYASRPDATADVLAAFETHQHNQRVKAEQAHRDAMARIPEKGKTIKVVKGRKVAIGTTGLCIWCGNGQYGKRVGLKTASGEVFWTAYTNVEVVL
jgi:hypothetical protein